MTPRRRRDNVQLLCGQDAPDGAAIENDRDMLLYQWGIDGFNTPERSR
jgi:hypothetical protein